MRANWLTALIRTIIFLIIAHIVFFILGYFIQTDIGIFNLPMVWAHWSDNWLDAIIGIVATIIVYLVIYFNFSGSKPKDLDQDE